MSKKIIRWIVFTVLLCLLSATATMLLIRHFRTVPFDQCSAVYQRYAHRDDLKTAFFKDWHIPCLNDSLGQEYLTTDLTVIVANDSLAFVSLMREWGKSEESIAYMMSRSSEEDYRATSIRPKGHPERVADTVMANNDVVAIVPSQKAVAFFHTSDNQVISLYSKIMIHLQNKINKSIPSL